MHSIGLRAVLMDFQTVTLRQPGFASHAVCSLREDLQLRQCAHAGRIKKPPTFQLMASEATNRSGFGLRQQRCRIANFKFAGCLNIQTGNLAVFDQH